MTTPIDEQLTTQVRLTFKDGALALPRSCTRAYR